MPAIPPTQMPMEHDGKRYSGVFSVSGNLMIARVPGVGSKSAELNDLSNPSASAGELLAQILTEASAQGLL